MKQPKVPNVAAPVAAAPAPPPAPRGPRFRYFSNPPSTLTVRLGDLTGGIPSGIRAVEFDPERRIEVSCAEIFNGPVPKISLSRLAGIAPECFQTQNFSEAQIDIPAAKLAPAYQLITASEVIDEPVVVEEELAVFAPPEETPPAPEIFAPVAIPPVEKTVSPVEPPPPQEIRKPATGPDAEEEVSAAERTPAVDPVAVVPIPPVEPPTPAGPGVLRKPFFPVPKAQTAPIEPVPPALGAVEAPPPPPPAVAPRAAAIPQTRRSFSLLPIFRRKEAEPEKADISVPPTPRARVEIPKPKVPLSPLVPPVSPPVVGEKISGPGPVLPPPPPFSAAEEPPAGKSPGILPVEAEASPAAEEAPPISKAPEPPPSEAVLVETEHLPVVGGKTSVEIPNQDALQAIFMTEEFLAMERVVELCGGLPGIKSCVLSHGSAVLASRNVPDSIDLVSLSAHAVEMLSGMRSSSAKMGIGAVPAVTVHSDKGPITFFHQDDLCLLVMHKDRGFIPGVREKLQQVVEELSRANLPLPIAAARSALEKWK